MPVFGGTPTTFFWRLVAHQTRKKKLTSVQKLILTKTLFVAKAVKNKPLWCLHQRGL